MEYISTNEAAKILKISRVAILKQITRGKLVATKVGRAYLIRKTDVKHEPS